MFVYVSVCACVYAWAWVAPDRTRLFFPLLLSKVNIPVLGRSMPSTVWSLHHVTPERGGKPFLSCISQTQTPQQPHGEALCSGSRACEGSGCVHVFFKKLLWLWPEITQLCLTTLPLWSDSRKKNSHSLSAITCGFSTRLLHILMLRVSPFLHQPLITQMCALQLC